MQATVWRSLENSQDELLMPLKYGGENVAENFGVSGTTNGSSVERINRCALCDLTLFTRRASVPSQKSQIYHDRNPY